MAAAACWTRPASRSMPRRAERGHIRLSFGGIEPAFGLGPIGAERIEFGKLMHKAFLRRDRDDDASIAQQYGLAQLQVPVTQGKLASLERGEREIGALEEIQGRLRSEE